MKRLLPPVRIHSWGGLGSQLFAIAIAEDFKSVSPNRSIKIVLHTGGVTRRIPEVVELFPEYEYEYQEDFHPTKKVTLESIPIDRYVLRNTFKKILSAVGFLAQCNDDHATKGLLPWVLSIRGHYSYRTINSTFMYRLAERCESMNDSKISKLSQSCIVHYRLGDLMVINEKNPISTQSIVSEYLKVQKALKIKDLIVFSDSPSEARSRFSSLVSDEFLVLDSRTSLVIANAIRAKYFIGTSSKVSFWIAGLRDVVYQSSSSLPSDNFDQYIKSTLRNPKHLIPYSTIHQ